MEYVTLIKRFKRKEMVGIQTHLYAPEMNSIVFHNACDECFYHYQVGNGVIEPTQAYAMYEMQCAKAELVKKPLQYQKYNPNVSY